MNGSMFQLARSSDSRPASVPCEICGLPIDSQYFDVASVVQLPAVGRQSVLARFELAPQYCGRFEIFSQFTDAEARDHSQVRTPGLRWLLLVNNRPLEPYLNLDFIVNPWGYGSFPVNIRLDSDAKVEFILRNESYTQPPATDPSRINLVGGRIVGRYWYNAAYSNPGHAVCRG